MQRMNSDVREDAALIQKYAPLVSAAGFDVEDFGAIALFNLGGAIIYDTQLTAKRIAVAAKKHETVLPSPLDVLPTLTAAERQALRDRIRSRHPELFGQ